MTMQELEQTRRTVSTPSGPVSYLDTGVSGPTALFVHGVGTNALLWRQAITMLASERRCVALDLPLHGHSPGHDGQDFSLPALAQGIEDFCAALRLQPVDLVAHDTGGAVAQVFAALHPERLASLTLTNCDTHDNLPPEAFKPTVELAAAGALAPSGPALLEDLRAARATVFASGYEDAERLDVGLVSAYLTPLLATVEQGKRFERFLVALRADDLLAIEAQLRRLHVPTMVVWGTGDAFFELSWAYWLRDTIPGVVEVVEIAGAKLFFPDERASELVGHLRRHWARTSAPLAAKG
jgi:pimeloyl-ACP methyl ester carboxylesterase